MTMQETRSILKDKIKQTALELGFSHVGFASAEALPEGPLLEWLRQGYHGTMAYMARDPEARLDPRKLLSGCATVICLAINYYTPHPTKTSEDQGRVSRYAKGRDYHKVIKKKLKRLTQRISELAPHEQHKMCVDSTPIQEKVWAQRAGIGWQGKNSNVITRSHGSWVFLSEILTTLPLPPDPPHIDFCGSCQRCIDSCPTDAIVEPYVVDATRCISYLTIESKEPTPPELTAQSQDWILGCDICQEVCPWNKFSQATTEEDFSPRLNHQIPLEAWDDMSDEAFVARFAGTPFMRPKREHMSRNALIAKHNLEAIS